MAQRILGMGDVVSLVERAQQAFDEEEAARLNKKLRKNEFDFNDLLSQIQHVKKMGNIKDLLGMIPGMGKMIENVDIDDDAFKPVEAIIKSMTPDERTNTTLNDASRRQRIAKGSGTTIQQVNALYKQLDDMKKAMKQINKMSPGGGMPMEKGAAPSGGGGMKSRIKGLKKGGSKSKLFKK
jgi:signal recognition particle subunit SRP54